MIRPHIRNIVLACLALLVLAGFVRADELTPTGVDSSLGEGIWIDENGTPVDAYFAGVIEITLTSDGGEQYDRDTLCVDLFTDIYLGVEYNTDVVDPDSVPGGNLARVAWLVDNALLPAQNQGISSQLPSSDWVDTAAQGAGIQLAIWDIVSDGGNGFSSGSVQASTTAGELTDPTVLAWAEEYEALSLGQSSDSAFVYENTAIGSGTPAQMLEGPEFADGGPQPVPEPATPALLGAALTGLWICKCVLRPIRRRRTG